MFQLQVQLLEFPGYLLVCVNCVGFPLGSREDYDLRKLKLILSIVTKVIVRENFHFSSEKITVCLDVSKVVFLILPSKLDSLEMEVLKCLLYLTELLKTL